MNGASLPAHHAQHFNVSSNATDFIVVMGDTRMVHASGGLAFAVEWFAAVTMSPVAAKMLHDTLGEAIHRYEAVAGEIKSLPGLITDTASGKNLAGDNVQGLFSERYNPAEADRCDLCGSEVGAMHAPACAHKGPVRS